MEVRAEHAYVDQQGQAVTHRLHNGFSKRGKCFIKGILAVFISPGEGDLNHGFSEFIVDPEVGEVAGYLARLVPHK